MGFCTKCSQERSDMSNKEVCNNCYRKYFWIRKNKKCNGCGEMKPHQAKGYCRICYLKLFHYDKVKAHNYKKWHNLDPQIYKEITKCCIICGFDKVVELHHLDKNHQNTDISNLAGLCPNHHRMLHMDAHKEEVQGQLRDAIKQRSI